MRVNQVLLKRYLFWLLPPTVAAIYVLSETPLYWTDFVVYQHRTTELILAFQTSFSAGIERILNSLNADYNLLYIIPLLPILLIFGTGRLAYIIALTVVYGLPFIGLIALITRLICQDIKPKKSVQSALALGALMPLTWIPLWRGFPDSVGMLCVVAASGVYLRQRRCWNFAAIGGLLALAVLFRRHFAYGGLAVGGAIALVELWDRLNPITWNSPGQLSAALGRYSRDMAVMTLAGLGLLVAVAPDFTYRALTANHRAVYASFSFPIPESLDYFASAYGYLIWALAIWGLGRSWRRRLIPPKVGAFLMLWGGLAIAFQVFLLRYDSVHYTLHLTPLVILGLTLLWLSLPRLSHQLLLSVLLLNLLLSLTPLGTQPFPGRKLFASAHPPLVRHDYDELMGLVDTLHQLTPNDEPLHLIAASSHLNRGLLRNAHWRRYPPDSIPLDCHIPCGIEIIGLPTADSNSIYPLEPLLAAEYIVLADPLQYHLPLTQQQVIAVPYQVFTESWAIADDFERLPQTFTLDGNVRVSLYQRRRPTTWQTAVKTLIEMQSRFGDRPGLQSDWVNLTPDTPLGGQYQGSNPANLSLETLSQPVHLLYIGNVANPRRVTVEMTPTPEAVPISVQLLNANGDPITSPQPFRESPFRESLSLTPSDDAAYLRLTLTPTHPTPVTLENLRVR
jgi:hypothetical protein